jgi:uncharacterized protein (TIGR00369 family)
MKKIVTPWAGEPTYHCFGCDPNSEHGLRMEFFEDGEYVVSHWQPRSELQGWRDTLHGGIQATLADEIASWVVFRKFQTSGVTSRMEVKYKKPVKITAEPITLRARAVKQMRNVVDIDVELYDAQGELCTIATCVYFLFSKQRAHDEFGFMEFKTEDEL